MTTPLQVAQHFLLSRETLAPECSSADAQALAELLQLCHDVGGLHTMLKIDEETGTNFHIVPLRYLPKFEVIYPEE